ncbi:hypothetical protein D0T85_02340 [Bacteroides sp. 519]|nr:hypothetical protein [Bacteroides sp. 519]
MKIRTECNHIFDDKEEIYSNLKFMIIYLNTEGYTHNEIFDYIKYNILEDYEDNNEIEIGKFIKLSLQI